MNVVCYMNLKGQNLVSTFESATIDSELAAW